MRGTVINIHAHGALMRLENGTLASVPPAELRANESAYAASLARRAPLDVVVDERGRHAVVELAGSTTRAEARTTSDALLVDTAFEERIGAYLKETEAWAPPDRPQPAERHFIRKKRHSAIFEARNKPA